MEDDGLNSQTSLHNPIQCWSCCHKNSSSHYLSNIQGHDQGKRGIKGCDLGQQGFRTSALFMHLYICSINNIKVQVWFITYDIYSRCPIMFIAAQIALFHKWNGEKKLHFINCWELFSNSETFSLLFPYVKNNKGHGLLFQPIEDTQDNLTSAQGFFLTFVFTYS